jgi:polyphosphate glucokinase
MKVLTIDIGGTGVKILATGQKEQLWFPSGPKMTPKQMVTEVKELAKDWEYDVVSIGYPGPVVKDRIAMEPHNLGRGWIRFDFKAAFKRPVKVINDAAMQALGSYRGGTMLFLGLGTGLGSALMVRGHIVPLELGQLSYKRGIVEDYLGIRGFKRLGRKKWRKMVAAYVERLIPALQLDDVVLGGGNVKKLEKLPRGCRAGDNANAFLGGFRLWEKGGGQQRLARTKPHHDRKKTKRNDKVLRPNTARHNGALKLSKKQER